MLDFVDELSFFCFCLVHPRGTFLALKYKTYLHAYCTWQGDITSPGYLKGVKHPDKFCSLQLAKIEL